MGSASARTVLIAGASIAGPALAYWLARYGFAPTVAERAPGLREGGYAIDVRGTAMEVARRMGLEDEIRSADVDMRGLSVVDSRGRVRASVGAGLVGNGGDDAELLRTDLGRILYTAARGEAEFLYGDAVTTVEDLGDRVRVGFTASAPREFDLVLAADGLHSTVREHAFGPEGRFLRYLGSSLAIFSLPNHLRLDHHAVLHNAPGLLACLYATDPDRPAKAVLGMRNAQEPPVHYRDTDGQRALLAERFAGMGWETPAILASLGDTADFYYDTVGQIRMDSWSKGRVALVGDAGYSPSPASGQGSSLALVGAYVLAGELAAADGDHRRAFSAYEDAMRSYVRLNQGIADSGGGFLVPATRTGAAARDLGLRLAGRFPGLTRLNTRMRRAANAVELKPYPERGVRRRT